MARAILFVSVTLISCHFTVDITAAASASDWAHCKNDSPNIEACTRILSDQGEAQNSRAIAFLYRGVAYASQNDNVHALADYGEAIKLDPNDGQSFSYRGAAYASAGDYRRAIEDFTRAIRINPNDAPTIDSRGAAYMRTGQFQKAIDDLDAAWRKGHFVNSLYARGWAKLKIGDIAGGNADIAAAKAYRPNLAEYDKYYGIRP